MSERVPEVSVGQNGARIAQLAIILSSLIACGESPAPHAPPPAPVVDAGPELAPRLPNDEGPFYPSQVRLAEERADVERLADVGICTECHADSVAQHNASAHARSSFDNPWYRAVVDRVRQDAGFTASRHCAGCHDPLLLVSGAMDRPIEPSDPLARAGITCLVCHGIVETNTQGNASYTLSSAPIPIPDPADEEEVAAHRARLAPAPLRTPGLCGSCHRGFLGTHTGGAHFLPGIDEIGPWRGSAWGDQQAQRIDDVTPPEGACRGCHMPSERIRGIELAAPEGFVASHRFAGGHSALAAQSGDASQLAAVEARQRSAATIDVAALVHEDGRRDLPVERGTVTPGERVTFDVVIRNQAAGHFFPGGARDLRDHWVAVRVRDARGRVIAQAGTEHAERVDPSAFVLGTGVLDEEGRIEREHLVHRFRALGWDHTIAPRDARAIRYALEVPRGAALPLSFEATLFARRHHAGVRAFGCASSRSERGRGFDEAARQAGSSVIDGCVEEPVIELASARATLGRPSEGRPTAGQPSAGQPSAGQPSAGQSSVGQPSAGQPSARPAWLRLYEHAMALSHDVQERTDDARPSLELALSEAPDGRTRAMVWLLRAQVEASQGRFDDAIEIADRVRASIGPHPAIDRVRGNAAAQVWRWELAASAYGRAAEAAPLDTAAHRDHARALGSLGRSREAWQAATRGLALFPRDEQLLRTQALALSALEDPRAEAAQQAYLQYRKPDDETTLRMRCDAVEPDCARDRLPIPTIELHP